MNKRAVLVAIVIVAMVAMWMRPQKRNASNAGARSFIMEAQAQTTVTGGGGGVTVASYASNCIPLAPTATTLSCAHASDNGTNIISTEGFIAPVGSASAPSYAFAAATTYGFTAVGGNGIINVSLGGNYRFSFLNSEFRVGASSAVTFSSSNDPNTAGADSFFGRRGAASFRFGTTDVNGVPVDQTISFQNAITGTDLPGAHATIDAPIGTGAGAGTKTCLNRALMGATGTTAQGATNGFCLGESKTLSNTSAQTTALITISVPSNSSGGASGTINVSCNDGTNFDSETVSFNAAYVNKAGVLTIGPLTLTTTTSATNSGSCTTAPTATAGTNSVNINVTPVITTIVPTTTTGTVLSLSSYATGNVTWN